MNILETRFWKEFEQQYPQKFYVENVRSYLNTSTQEAQEFIDKAVDAMWIYKGLEFIAPDGAVVLSRFSDQPLPGTVEYHLLENDVYESYEVSPLELKTRPFYSSTRNI